MSIVPSNRPTGKKVQLMATCLCDAFYDDVARATVEVLEHLGCQIEFPEGQTCCGQPAFNSGDWPAARRVLRHCMKVFEGDTPLIIPSGSCAAMLFHSAALAFEKEADLEDAIKLGNRSWELIDFIVNGLGIKSWKGRFNGSIALHRSCHTRGTDSINAALTLLKSIDGLEIKEFDETEQCCGFGGTFSVTFPNISAAMGNLKLSHLQANQPQILASVDSSCLMHLTGLAQKQGHPVKSMHVIQILRDALKSA